MHDPGTGARDHPHTTCTTTSQHRWLNGLNVVYLHSLDYGLYICIECMSVTSSRSLSADALHLQERIWTCHNSRFWHETLRGCRGEGGETLPPSSLSAAPQLRSVKSDSRSSTPANFRASRKYIERAGTSFVSKALNFWVCHISCMRIEAAL